MQPEMDKPPAAEDVSERAGDEAAPAAAASTSGAAPAAGPSEASQPAIESRPHTRATGIEEQPPAASAGPIEGEGLPPAAPWSGPCVECLRRSWLVAQIGHHLDHHRFDARKLAGLLEHEDLELVHEVAQSDEPELRARYAGFDPAWLPVREGIERICLHDPRYPRLLRTTVAPPAVLYVGGRTDAFEALAAPPSVAIVGSRRATSEGEAIARRLAAEIAGAGTVVISGAALGIDSAAHSAALDVGGRTISVLPCGIDVPYPARMKDLRDQLLRHACLVSELPPQVLPRSWSFPARNRITVGLAQALVVVEAAQRSGSMSAARMAQLVGRPIGTVPGPIDGPNSAGTLRLLQGGAYPVVAGEDVARMLAGVASPATEGRALQGVGPETRASSPSSPGFLPPGADALDNDLRTVLQAVAYGHETAAALTAQGINGSTALTGLATLELRGFLQRRADGSYRITGRG